MGGLNCYFPMPFEKSAVIEFRNTGNDPVTVFYYVDFEIHDALQDPVLHFHATLNSEHTVRPAGQARQKGVGKFDNSIANRDWHENYVFLNAEKHRGHYVGT